MAIPAECPNCNQTNSNVWLVFHVSVVFVKRQSCSVTESATFEPSQFVPKSRGDNRCFRRIGSYCDTCLCDCPARTTQEGATGAKGGGRREFAHQRAQTHSVLIHFSRSFISSPSQKDYLRSGSIVALTAAALDLHMVGSALSKYQRGQQGFFG